MTLKSEGWWDRASELMKNKHIRQQVRRIRKAQRVIAGEMNIMSFKETLQVVCQQIAALELNPDLEGCANDSRIMVRRSPGMPENFTIYLDAATVYGMQKDFSGKMLRKEEAS